jgi:hypothetical protein
MLKSDEHEIVGNRDGGASMLNVSHSSLLVLGAGMLRSLSGMCGFNSSLTHQLSGSVLFNVRCFERFNDV